MRSYSLNCRISFGRNTDSSGRYVAAILIFLAWSFATAWTIPGALSAEGELGKDLAKDQEPAKDQELAKKITEVIKNGNPPSKSRSAMLARILAELRMRSDDESLDPRLELAYGLALANLGKTLDATKTLSSAVEDLAPELKPIARCAKAWSLVAEKRYAESLDEMVELSGEIAAVRPEDEAVLGELIEVSARLFGFQLGPKQNLRVGGLERKRDLFRSKLALEQRELFDSVIQETVTQFCDIKDDYLASQLEDKLQTEEKRERLEEEVDQAKSRLDRERANLEDTKGAESARLAAARNNLDAQYGADRDAAFRLGNEINLLRNENAYLQSLIDRCYRIVTDSQGRRIRESTDPIRVRRCEQQIFDNEALIHFHNQQLFTLELRGDRRVRQREQLTNREFAAANDIANKRAELERKERALEKKEGKVAAAAKPVEESSKTSAISRRMNALTTYVEFPYRVASKRLLEEFQ